MVLLVALAAVVAFAFIQPHLPGQADPNLCAVDPATGTMADTVEQQAAQSLSNLKAILAEAGLSMNNVVKTVIFLADINDFAAVNAEYAKAFTEPFPARSCVQVAAIPKGAKLEIECIAVRD